MPSRQPWPHAPPHWTFSQGSYFVTASTFHRKRLFDSPEKLDVVTGLLIHTAKEYGWQLRAWAVMSNHYHFLADSPSGTGETLRVWLRVFHRRSAIEVNRLSETTGRRVWMNFRDSLITQQTSYLARLHYINQNPVKHRLVANSKAYRWCSAAWFESHASKGFVECVARFKTDRLKIQDDFDP